MERRSEVNKKEDEKTCLLCCQNLPLITTATSGSTSSSSCSVKSAKFLCFFKDVDNVYVSNPPTDDAQAQLKDETEVDLCLSCRRILTPAVEVHEKAMETEVRVGELQREILKEMKTLQGQLCQFYVEMKKVKEAIEKFPRGVEGQAEAEASSILRQKIFGVVRDLRLYNAQMSPKIMLCKSEDDHDHDHALEMEMETQAETETSFDFSGFVDIQSEECDTDLDFHQFEAMEMKYEPCEIEMDRINNEHFAESETEVTKEQFSAAGTDAAAAVKVKARRRVKTKWSRSAKYAKTKTYRTRKPKPPPRDDEWLPESEIRELIARRRKRSEYLASKTKISQTSQTTKTKTNLTNKGIPTFKKSIIARIITTKGVTVTLPKNKKNDLSLLKPFQQTPMKYDSSTDDTISVGGIPVIIDENKKCLRCSSCALEFKSGRNRLAVEFQAHEHILGHHLQTLKCLVCDKAMTKISSLTNHLLCHQGHNPCDICGRPFNERKKMIRHKITHMNASERAEATARGEGRTFESFLSPKERQNCSAEVISTLREIIGKEKTSEWKRKIICRIIKEGFQKQSGSDEDSPATKFPISYDQATDKLSVSGIEIIMNETEVCLECSSCSVKFHGQNAVKRVEVSMHNHILSKHFDALRCPFPVDQCTARIRSFETVTKYNQHLKDYHPKEEQEKAVCETCGKIFKSGPSLNSHRALHEKAKLHQPKPKSMMRLNLPLKHKCSTCSKGFWSRNQLKKHAVSHLSPEQKRKFICNRCGKRFHLVSYLNRHQKVTCFEKGQELPRVPCQFCSRTLKNKDQLRKHIATIHPEQNIAEERPFQCSMCPQQFMTEWNMEMHERVKHSVAEGDHVDNDNGDPDGGDYKCRKGCGKLIATAHGRKVHESYCDGKGCKTDRERSKSEKNDF